MKWINAEQQVTGIIYDEEHEENLERTMSVEEMLDTYTNEGCPTIYSNPEQSRWIPVSERLPEEHEWIGTKTFGTTISDEVYVTFENPKGERFTEHLSFQNGKVSNFVQREIDAFHKGSVPIAWMPLPKPYKPQESEDKE